MTLTDRLARVHRSTWYLATAVLIAVAAVILLAMGRVPICKCGYVTLWQGVVQSAENSQQLTDWYTFSHVIHGFGFYGCTWLVARPLAASARGSRSRRSRGVVGGVENSRLRDQPVSRGDDLARLLRRQRHQLRCRTSCAMMAGFGMATRLPVWWTVSSDRMELFVAYMIRDNLTLNILMLIHPIEAIRKWQGGG